MDNGATVIETETVKESSEIAPALVSVHPLEKFIVVVVGPELRVFDLENGCSVSLSDDSGGPSHSDAIRAVCFSANGRLFASAGDDKLVKIWKTGSWNCLQTVFSEKRVSAISVSKDDLYVTFADKFGVVWVVPVCESSDDRTKAEKNPVPLLGHYCSIITSLSFSQDGRFIASADRDFKIRITVFPNNPLKGAHEIQSFCLGHTDFVSCLAFVNPSQHVNRFLLSGSGDSTVRLWDFKSGHLLDTCEVGKKAGLLGHSGTDDLEMPVVTDICATPDGSLAAVAIQSLQGIMLLKCEYSTAALAVLKVVSMGEGYVPTSLGTSLSAGRLWAVIGASNLPNGTTRRFARLRVVSNFCNDLESDQDPILLGDNEIPHSEKVLSELQGSFDIAKDGDAVMVAVEAVKVGMRNLMNKKQYSVEKRDFRKRGRNDRKLKR